MGGSSGCLALVLLWAAQREQGRYGPCDGFGPVSYTHLDVYKRQVQTLDYDAALKRGLVQEFDPEGPYMEQLARLIDTQPLKDAGLRLVLDLSLIHI